MKNKRLIIGIIILSLTLIPIPFKLKDGGTTELKSSDKIRIKITRPTSGINDFYVAGNKIIITYNGNINESYPAQIDAIKIKLKSQKKM